MQKNYYLSNFSILVITIFCTINLAYGQDKVQFFITDSTAIFKDPVNGFRYSSFMGGFHAPQFQKIDYNNDGKSDLVVFDRLDNKLLTFTNVGSPGAAKYQYDPRYEPYFPKMKNWVMFRDYNNDGKLDIFTITDANWIIAYKNITPPGGPPQFQKYGEYILYDNTSNNPDTFLNYSILGSPRSHMPDFADIDGDGDFDFITFSNVGGALMAYQNMREEYNLPNDSLLFRFSDWCWGGFLEPATSNDIFIGNCQWGGGYPRPKQYYRHEAGSSLCFLDMDGDSDKELIMGNSEFNNLLLLWNGKVQHTLDYDSIVTYDTIFPQNSLRAYMPLFPAAFFVDIDGDNIRDLMVAACRNDFIKDFDQAFYYKNTGSDTVPNFEIQSTNFLQNESQDIGTRTAPVFIDIDNDGDLDLVVGYDSYLQPGKLALYLNKGTNKEAVFEPSNMDFLGLSAYGLSKPAPHFRDLNDDGKPDLLLGTGHGKIYYFRNNTPDGGGMNFVFNIIDSNFLNKKFNTYAVPYTDDIDGDGLYDLIIGNSKGNIYFYKNTASNSNPNFTYVTDSLGHILTNEMRYDFSTPALDDKGHSSPVIIKIDALGNKGILSGTTNGVLRLWRIGANPNGYFTEIDSFYSLTGIQNENYYQWDLGSITMPAVGDINGDTTVDIMVGIDRGGFKFLSATKLKTVGFEKLTHTIYTKLYPNPATESFFIEFPLIGINRTVTVRNVTGAEIATYVINDNMLISNFSTTQYSSGVYFIELKLEGKLIATHKLSIIR